MRKTTKVIQKYTIISNKTAAEDHFLLKIKAPHLAANAYPGQFVNIKIEEDTTAPFFPLLRIPLGIHRIGKEKISFLYKVVGEKTELLSKKRKGEKIDILGPLGTGFDVPAIQKNKNKRILMVAGGHGVAPLYALAEQLTGRKDQIEVFLGACGKKHIVCDKEFRKLKTKVYVATDDGSKGFKGHVTWLLEKHLEEYTRKEIRNTIIYACGPKPMLAAVARLAKRFKIPAQVSVDEYMACGIGACLGCAIRTRDGYKMVCKDGPVFDAQEIDWKNT